MLENPQGVLATMPRLPRPWPITAALCCLDCIQNFAAHLNLRLTCAALLNACLSVVCDGEAINSVDFTSGRATRLETDMAKMPATSCTNDLHSPAIRIGFNTNMVPLLFRIQHFVEDGPPAIAFKLGFGGKERQLATSTTE